MKGSIFICEKNYDFVVEDSPSSKFITMEEALYAVKVDRIGNFVK